MCPGWGVLGLMERLENTFFPVLALDCGLDRCIIIIDSLFSLYLNIFVSHILIFHLTF